MTLNLRTTATVRLLTATGAIAIAACMMAAPTTKTTVAPPGPAVEIVNLNQDTSGATVGAINKEATLKKVTIGALFAPGFTTSRLLNVEATTQAPNVIDLVAVAPGVYTLGSPTIGSNSGTVAGTNNLNANANNSATNLRVADIDATVHTAPATVTPNVDIIGTNTVAPATPDATAAPPAAQANKTVANATLAAAGLVKGGKGLTALA